jgi:hypothetical protein
MFMNNIIGELLPKIMGGYFERNFHLKDSSHIQTHYIFNRRASVFSLFIKKKPNRVGMPVTECYLAHDGGNRSCAYLSRGLRYFPRCRASKPCISTNHELI